MAKKKLKKKLKSELVALNTNNQSDKIIESGTVATEPAESLLNQPTTTLREITDALNNLSGKYFNTSTEQKFKDLANNPQAFSKMSQFKLSRELDAVGELRILGNYLQYLNIKHIQSKASYICDEIIQHSYILSQEMLRKPMHIAMIIENIRPLICIYKRAIEYKKLDYTSWYSKLRKKTNLSIEIEMCGATSFFMTVIQVLYQFLHIESQMGLSNNKEEILKIKNDLMQWIFGSDATADRVALSNTMLESLDLLISFDEVTLAPGSDLCRPVKILQDLLHKSGDYAYLITDHELTADISSQLIEINEFFKKNEFGDPEILELKFNKTIEILTALTEKEIVRNEWLPLRALLKNWLSLLTLKNSQEESRTKRTLISYFELIDLSFNNKIKADIERRVAYDKSIEKLRKQKEHELFLRQEEEKKRFENMERHRALHKPCKEEKRRVSLYLKEQAKFIKAQRRAADIKEKKEQKELLSVLQKPEISYEAVAFETELKQFFDQFQCDEDPSQTTSGTLCLIDIQKQRLLLNKFPFNALMDELRQRFSRKNGWFFYKNLAHHGVLELLIEGSDKFKLYLLDEQGILEKFLQLKFQTIISEKIELNHLEILAMMMIPVLLINISSDHLNQKIKKVINSFYQLHLNTKEDMFLNLNFRHYLRVELLNIFKEFQSFARLKGTFINESSKLLEKHDESQYLLKRDVTVNYPQKIMQIIADIENKGYKAYFVGGCVRDLLLNKEPSDYDCISDCPKEVLDDVLGYPAEATPHMKDHVLFQHTVVVNGVYYGMDITLTSSLNLFEDASTRDFSINCFYLNSQAVYAPLPESEADLMTGIIRSVKAPEVSFNEDPVRMLRAIRLKAKTGFNLTEDIERGFILHRTRLLDLSLEILLSHLKKMIFSVYANDSFNELLHHHFLSLLIPGFDEEKFMKSDFIKSRTYQCLEEYVQQITDTGKINERNLNELLVSLFLFSSLYELDEKCSSIEVHRLICQAFDRFKTIYLWNEKSLKNVDEKLRTLCNKRPELVPSDNLSATYNLQGMPMDELFRYLNHLFISEQGLQHFNQFIETGMIKILIPHFDKELWSHSRFMKPFLEEEILEIFRMMKDFGSFRIMPHREMILSYLLFSAMTDLDDHVVDIYQLMEMNVLSLLNVFPLHEWSLNAVRVKLYELVNRFVQYKAEFQYSPAFFNGGGYPHPPTLTSSSVSSREEAKTHFQP